MITPEALNEYAGGPISPHGEYVDARTLVKDVSGLVSPPEVCMRILDLMRSSSASARDFGKVVGRDPSLTARLLRIVNSSFYGFSSRIETVSRAIAVIGTRDLYNLSIAVSAVSTFSKIDSRHVDMTTFWRHGIFCGLVARGLATRANILHPERLFVAGLLHDIGSLVMFHRLPERSASLLERAAGDEEALHGLERDALGFTHADVGGLLLTLWQLPATLHGAVRGHHAPPDTAVGRLEAGIVHLADRLANSCPIGALYRDGVEALPPSDAAWAAIGLERQSIDVQRIIDEVAAQTTETVQLLTARR